ncbi:hypothetical protein [Terasakiella sp. SH-1]|uniref:hypothetical protein n=1 Tax=Terasakiella sp. SH-1 TaxID=2560057 RepID=UPI001073D48B|nr:hypothetical protein [Terasakiella sp. SH-1]
MDTSNNMTVLETMWRAAALTLLGLILVYVNLIVLGLGFGGAIGGALYSLRHAYLVGGVVLIILWWASWKIYKKINRFGWLGNSAITLFSLFLCWALITFF